MRKRGAVGDWERESRTEDEDEEDWRIDEEEEDGGPE